MVEDFNNPEHCNPLIYLTHNVIFRTLCSRILPENQGAAMLRLSKRSEYGIMAMKYVAEMNNGERCSARAISEYFNISYDMIAKILQKLMRNGLVRSKKGKNGGYQLVRESRVISLGDIISAIEGRVFSSDCDPEKGLSCDQKGLCNLENTIKRIRRDITNYFNGIYLNDLDNDM
jgi:Rrf2 family protein